MFAIGRAHGKTASKRRQKHATPARLSQRSCHYLISQCLLFLFFSRFLLLHVLVALHFCCEALCPATPAPKKNPHKLHPCKPCALRLTTLARCVLTNSRLIRAWRHIMTGTEDRCHHRYLLAFPLRVYALTPASRDPLRSTPVTFEQWAAMLTGVASTALSPVAAVNPISGAWW